ncbi:hypothetical protein [Picosynechococcus sp. PCC 7117]|uniref:hypothetical protein n=1 Tax=Picosynechococcus sp. PCC 7117 TaxID=195498 RepID=UPI0012EE2172|nr:hypothetical protein [Picosynechococcus sp. PCC 7117]
MHYNRIQPRGWTSLSHWGEAIAIGTDGFIEMKDLKMTCEVDGQRQTIVSGLSNVGAGRYLIDPWYGGDNQGAITITKTPEGYLKIPVKQGHISHWWSSKRPRIINGRNCRVESTIKASPGVYFSIGGDWWIDQSSGWAGDMVNNVYMGRSSWFDYNGGWQEVVFQ